MKTWFTLIELVIVVLIILIILLSVIFYWSNQLVNTQFRVDKQLLTNTHFDVVRHWLSSSYYYWQPFDSMRLTAQNQSSNIKNYLSWANEKKLFESKKLKNSYISWFNIQWNNFLTWNFIIESYKVWCNFKWNGSIFTWWKVKFDLIPTNWAEKACFNINLSSCKLFEINCN